jgi:hypothetical protein
MTKRLIGILLWVALTGMASAQLLAPMPRLQFVGSDGKPVVNGRLCTYVAGTSTPLATYSDSTLLSANTNPLVTDSFGRPTSGGVGVGIYLLNQSYKFVLASNGTGSQISCPTNGSVLWTQDNIAIDYVGSTPTFTSATIGDATAGAVALQQGTNAVAYSTVTMGARFNVAGTGAKNVRGVYSVTTQSAGSTYNVAVTGQAFATNTGNYTNTSTGHWGGNFAGSTYHPSTHVGATSISLLGGVSASVAMGFDGLDSVTTAKGVSSYLFMDAGGTITNWYGYHQFGTHVTSGTVTNYHGFYYDAPTGGTITNEYGLYIEAPSRGSSIKEGIHNEGTLNQVGVSTFAAKPVLSSTASPAATDACTAGTITWDASYIYVCTATGAWKRAALTGGY